MFLGDLNDDCSLCAVCVCVHGLVKRNYHTL